MKLKQRPEDFIVRERPSRQWQEKGDVWVFELQKKDMTTQHAVKLLAHANGLRIRDIRYAGLKDRRAITSQYISSPKKLRSVPALEIKHVGFTDEHIRLGELISNEFVIKVQDVSQTHDVQIINYFGEQRFSKDNLEVGLMIVKGDYFGAAQRLGSEYPEVQKQLLTQPTSPLHALNKVPFRIMLLLVHAVQSYAFNEAVKRFLQDSDGRLVKYSQGEWFFPVSAEDQQVPLVGAASELGDWQKHYDPVFEELGITAASFHNKQIPGLTLEGGMRSLLSPVKDKSVSLDNKTAIVKIQLGPGAYATVAVKAVLS